MNQEGLETKQENKSWRKSPTGIVWNPSFLRAVAKQFPAVCPALEKHKDYEKGRCQGVCCVVCGFSGAERPFFLGGQKKCSHPEKKNGKGLTSEQFPLSHSPENRKRAAH